MHCCRLSGTGGDGSLTQRERELIVTTRGKGFYEITRELIKWVNDSNIRTGVLTVFLRHTSASLLIQENADPDVRVDLEAFFNSIAPEDDSLYVHTQEGSDDMPAHIRSALTQSQLSIPVSGGRLALGTWQGVYVYEHRRIAHRRRVALHLLGD